MAEHTVHDVVNGTLSMGAQPVDVSDHKQTSGASVEGGSYVEAKTSSEDAVDGTVESTASGGARATDAPRMKPCTDMDMLRILASDIGETGWRERANSFKKPKAFQPVSVTKTFLGKSISSDTQRSIEKSSPNDQSSSIVRPGSQPPVQKKILNLKTGSSSRIATARAATPASGPDAAKVWNRNQPVAPPPPKQFTDEELKQQYGIHMATRLEAGESGTQSKWADIDDDDDNWVPDGVMEWTDGTKTSLAPTMPSPKPSPKPQPAEPREPSPANEPLKPQAVAPSTGKTILRPGVRSSTMTLGKPGLILRGQPESTAQATSSTPPAANARSPWATLPPVDKASPITFNPPAPAPSSSHRTRRPSQDYEMPSPQQPTRELAADDFNRWNDVDRQSKELFNSQSGRYEPVKGSGRRGSIRNEGHRRPSVLQRPSQVNGSYPDAAGSHQILGDDVRLDIANHKQHADESAIDSSQAETANDFSRVSDASHAEVRSTAPNTHQSSEQPTRTAEEERAEQQRLMKERIELNRRRIQAEREREEEAVKERIRLKMKALDAEKEKKEAAHKKQEERKRLEEVQSSQPSPPTLGINGEPAQALSAKTISEPPLPATQVQLTPPKSPATGQGLPSQVSAADDLLVPSRDGLKSHASGSSSPRTFEQDARSWTQMANRNSANSGWAGSGIPGPTAAGGNVWGPPSNDKSLGNGVFESGSSALQRSPNRSIQRPGPPPGPIGPLTVPPRVTNDSGHFQTAPPSIGPAKGHSATVPSEQATLRYGQAGKPSSTGRPRTDLSAVTRAWGNVQAAIAQGEADRKARQAAREAELAADPNAPEPVPNFTVNFRKTDGPSGSDDMPRPALEENKGLLSESEPAFSSGPSGAHAAQPPIQAPIGSMPHSRFFGPNAPNMPHRVQWTVPGYSRSPSPPPPEAGGHPAFEAGNGPRPRVSFPPGKPTVRLPPPMAHMPNGFISERAPSSNVIMPQRSTSGVYGGSKPIVQQAAWQDRFNDLFGRHTAPISVPKFPNPAVIPPKPHHQPSVAISSASRVPLDAGPVRATTVSLPREKTKVNFALPEGSVESKPSEEEMMEDRGFGSLPTVKLPQIDPSTDFAATPRGGSKAANAEKNFAFGSTSDFKEIDALLEGQNGPHISVVVRLRGMQEITKVMPRKSDGRKKSRGGDKRKVSGQNSTHAAETSVNGPQSPHEKETGDRRSSWNKSSRGPPRKKRADGHSETPSNAEKTAEFEKGKRNGSAQWNHNPRRVTSRAA